MQNAHRTNRKWSKWVRSGNQIHTCSLRACSHPTRACAVLRFRVHKIRAKHRQPWSVGKTRSCSYAPKAKRILNRQNKIWVLITCKKLKQAGQRERQTQTETNELKISQMRSKWSKQCVCVWLSSTECYFVACSRKQKTMDRYSQVTTHLISVSFSSSPFRTTTN